MEGKLQELTNKIYQEGVEKAKAEGKTIIDSSKQDADLLISNAKKEAENIINNAKKDAEQLKSKILSEIKMASSQSISSLKQEIANLLSQATISTSTKTTFNDTDFIKNLIKEIVTKWDSSKNLDLNIILPEKSKTEFTDFFKTKAADILNKGVEIKFEGRMDAGFKIGPKDNSFILSFTDKDFIQFFQSFLKPKTKEILFSGE